MRRKDRTQTATEALPSSISTTSTAFALVVGDGLDAPARWVVEASTPTRAFVGTSSACSFRLTDPSVSRRHASFEVRGGRLHLSDMGSTNGTFVNGICVVEAFLDGGEFVRLGQTSIHVQQLEVVHKAKLSPMVSFGRLIGSSEEMKRLYPLCRKLADSDVPVIIEGETGTGKEVLAESLHRMSARANGPFEVFDCTTVPPNLLEASLFGHEKGAFTGALRTAQGVFERAHEGTLLIDEIGELQLDLQPKLLRAIQKSEIKRVGGSRSIGVDVRVIAATRRNLDREVQAGRFRDDLFFRLNVARLELPPLRRRRSDIRVLAEHFWNKMAEKGKIPTDLLSRLEDYDWPGNVRELENTIARCVALGELAHLPKHGGATKPGSGQSGDFLNDVVDERLPFTEARALVMREFEKRFLERALDLHGGNVSKAATASGLGRRYFHVLQRRVRDR